MGFSASIVTNLDTKNLSNEQLNVYTSILVHFSVKARKFIASVFTLKGLIERFEVYTSIFLKIVKFPSIFKPLQVPPNYFLSYVRNWVSFLKRKIESR